MRAVKVKDTKPEMALRRGLRARGLTGYRVDAPLPLEGLRRRADITFVGLRVAVFVDGCWWHGCTEPGHFKPSGRNEAWWRAKIDRTRARDADTNERLRAAGWTAVRVWEHEDAEEAAERVASLVLERRRAR